MPRDEQLAGYGNIPVYRAVLDREGARGPGDVSVVGDEASVSAQLRRLSDIGATDFVDQLVGAGELVLRGMESHGRAGRDRRVGRRRSRNVNSPS